MRYVVEALFLEGFAEVQGRHKGTVLACGERRIWTWLQIVFHGPRINGIPSMKENWLVAFKHL